MASTAAVDIAHLRSWIGSRREARDTVTPRLTAGLLATLGRSPDGAKAGEPAPAAIHWCLAPPIATMGELGPDGHPARGGFLPPVPLPRRMWAGGALTFHDQILTGDDVTIVSTVKNVEMKTGRSGPLCFVTVDHQVSTARGLAVCERQDLVYREMEAKAAAPFEQSGIQGDDPADFRQIIHGDPVLLFRYSALTFNGHRIHYDRDHAMGAEGYGGLVVHGPLQATLLLEFAMAHHNGAVPCSFSFRGLSPLIDGSDFSLNARRGGDAMDLWVSNADGHKTMSATAHWNDAERRGMP